MKVGLIGLPAVGKSTLFHLLTGAVPSAVGDKTRPVLGTARIPDSRVDILTSLYRPKKTTYATLAVAEIPGFMPEHYREKTGGTGVKGLDIKGFVDAVRDVDAFVHVVRGFPDPSVPHVLGDVNPPRDLQALTSELLLTDWQLVQTRLERLAETKKKQPGHEKEVEVLGRVGTALEDEVPVYALPLTDDEREALQGYTFFTEKPVIVGVNLPEDQVTGGYQGESDLRALAETMSAPVVEFSAQVEAEMLELDADDRRLFMEDLGLTSSGIERLAQAVYERLGLMSYFTVGEDEVRAWTVRRGADAREAAGVIHSDIARGFIRAEVADYEELVEAGGWNALKEKGRVRLEGKEYPVQDGDVMSFRFNV